jgi:hypothetical protein
MKCRRREDTLNNMSIPIHPSGSGSELEILRRWFFEVRRKDDAHLENVAPTKLVKERWYFDVTRHVMGERSGNFKILPLADSTGNLETTMDTCSVVLVFLP